MPSEIFPVILSGGSGTRLWPLSRRAYPKQFLPLLDEETLLQSTARRVRAAKGFGAPLVICNEEHRFIIAEQLRLIDIEPSDIILEPVGRNTAPAAAAAALATVARDPDGIMLVMPSDHSIGDEAAFLADMAVAAKAAEAGALVTFGIRPTRPETGYGYIRQGDTYSDIVGCHRVDRFVEKPVLEEAERLIAEGGHVWNSGIFMFRAARLLEEMKRYQPDVLAACEQALTAAKRDLSFTRLDAAAFADSPSISIDHAIMEKTEDAAVVPASFDWSDVGAWDSAWQATPRDVDGNVLLGDVMADGSEGCYLRSESRLVAALGLKDIVVVETKDAVLVADKSRAQSIRALVDRLTAEDRGELDVHTRVYRPWGHYEDIDLGTRFRVKHICVHPGRQLSLQMHHHRAEHWIVVQGTARVTRGEEEVLLTENESTFIPIGVTHRLENPGRIDLKLIEVQSGSYLDEDDIVRFADSYGRQ